MMVWYLGKSMKIGILIKSSGIEKTTAFLEVIKILIEENAQVHIVIANRAVNDREEQFYCDNENVSVEVLNEYEDKSAKIEKVKNLIRKSSILEAISGTVVSAIQGLNFERKRKLQGNDADYAYETFLTKEMREYVVDQSFDCLWVTDEYGLLWSKWINEHDAQKHKVIYHCLELYWEHYCLQSRKKWRYSREYLLFEEARKQLVQAWKIIIQDEARWKVLCKYTGLDEHRDKIIIPVSIGDYQTYSKNVLLKRLNISAGKRIIFYPTLLAPKRGCLELVHITKELPEEYVTVIHGFAAVLGFVDRLQRKVGEDDNIMISNAAFEYQELIDMHQDVWCVFLYYGEADNNDRYIANSSNKLAMSLQAGKPIITIGNHMLDQLCEEWHCGVVLKGWTTEDMKTAVTELAENYDVYCKAARKCYEERYDIRKYSEELYKDMYMKEF